MNEVIFANGLYTRPSLQRGYRDEHIGATSRVNRINGTPTTLAAVYSLGRLETLIIRGSQAKSLIESLGQLRTHQ